MDFSTVFEGPPGLPNDNHCWNKMLSVSKPGRSSYLPDSLECASLSTRVLVGPHRVWGTHNSHVAANERKSVEIVLPSATLPGPLTLDLRPFAFIGGW